MTLFFNVTRCRYAEKYREMGVAGFGHCLYCYRDEPFAAGFNPGIKFERRQTIMEGAACCDFKFFLDTDRGTYYHPDMGGTQHKLRIKIWIERETGDSIFGEGQMHILETIRDQGSINAAAKALGMGYRSMWGRLRKMEKRLGKPLLERHKGGAAGGHSDLTPEAVEMIDKFKRLQQEITDASETIFKKIYY